MRCLARRGDRRALCYAIAASLALHAGVLAVRFNAGVGAAPAASRPIVAYLAPAEVTPPPARPPVIRRAVPKALPAAREAAGVPGEAPAPPSTEEPALDEATAIARYRYQLIGAALAHKRYPREAIEAGWQGDVLLRVAVAPSGASDVSVKASSGVPVLDEQALEAFRVAAPSVPLPPTLRGQAFGVDVRAVYSLQD